MKHLFALFLTIFLGIALSVSQALGCALAIQEAKLAVFSSEVVASKKASPYNSSKGNSAGLMIKPYGPANNPSLFKKGIVLKLRDLQWKAVFHGITKSLKPLQALVKRSYAPRAGLPPPTYKVGIMKNRKGISVSGHTYHAIRRGNVGEANYKRAEFRIDFKESIELRADNTISHYMSINVTLMDPRTGSEKTVFYADSPHITRDGKAHWFHIHDALSPGHPVYKQIGVHGFTRFQSMEIMNSIRKELKMIFG